MSEQPETSSDPFWAICSVTSETRPDGNRVTVFGRRRPITEEQVQVARSALRILDEDYEQGQLNLVLTNFQTFFAQVHQVPQSFETARHEATNPLLRVQTGLATSLFNWLQSIRAYLDHTERRLKRRFGDTSDESEAFKRATANEYDGVFAYRFFYKLRNYGHVDFPAIALSLKERAPLGLPRRRSVDVTFQRDALLESFDWDRVGAGLRAMPAQFGVLPLMIAMMQCLDRVKASVSEIEFPFLARQVQILDSLRGLLGDEEGNPTIVRFETDENGHPRMFEMLPISPYVLPTNEDLEGGASVQREQNETTVMFDPSVAPEAFEPRGSEPSP